MTQAQQAQNQPPQEDPMMVAARAEEAKAQADLMAANNKQQETLIKAQAEARKAATEEFRAATDRINAETDRIKALGGIQANESKDIKNIADAEATVRGSDREDFKTMADLATGIPQPPL